MIRSLHFFFKLLCYLPFFPSFEFTSSKEKRIKTMCWRRKKQEKKERFSHVARHALKATYKDCGRKKLFQPAQG